jgi:hypothetical protein
MRAAIITFDITVSDRQTIRRYLIRLSFLLSKPPEGQV